MAVSSPKAGPARPRRKKLRKGTRLLLGPCLLLCLSQQEAHGYQLFDQVLDLGLEGDCLDLRMIYRDLEEMEKQGLVSSAPGQHSRGPARKVYSITQKGREKLKVWINNLGSLGSQIKKIQQIYLKDSKGAA